MVVSARKDLITMGFASQLLVCLGCAHVIGDFVLQSDGIAKKKHEWPVLFKHTLAVALLSYLFCGLWREWRIPVVVLATHALIDLLKTKASSQTLVSFAADQIAHIAVLTWLAFSVDLAWTCSGMTGQLFWVRHVGPTYLRALILVVGMATTASAGSVIIGLAVSPFLKELERHRKQAEDDISPESRGFEQGGKTIGQLERALIYLLVMVGQPAGIGFLVAAKSVFRFGELKEHQHRMEAEYIIIGTLMSFGYGITVAFLAKHLMSLI